MIICTSDQRTLTRIMSRIFTYCLFFAFGSGDALFIKRSETTEPNVVKNDWTILFENEDTYMIF